MSLTVGNISGYIHQYEAKPLTEGTSAEEIPKNRLVTMKDGSQVVLTEKASKQMQKDKEKYSEYLFAQVQMESCKSQEEAAKKAGDDMAKILAVFRSMCNGDIVPASDEEKLIAYDPKMYQLAKSAQAMAQQAEREEKESMWDEDEEAAFRDKMDELNQNVSDALAEIPDKMTDLSTAQIENIVVTE